MAFAIAVVSGAAIGSPLPVVVTSIGAAAAVLLRRRSLLLIAGFLLAGSLAADARSGLHSIPAGPFDATVVVAGDPSERGGGVEFDARSRDGRVEVVGYGAVGRRMLEAEVGQRLVVAGTSTAPPHPARLISRHVRMRVVARSIAGPTSVEPWAIPVDAIRGVVSTGADPLPTWQRPIYLGFVLGDDRGSSPAIVDDFERAGLSHLLVVSGENLAFVLVVASPLLRRLGRRRRWIVTAGLLLLFAAVTRFEPSVLRATAMAAVVVLGRTMGRRTTGLVALADAVALLVLIDPLLVWALGFRLSVAATFGIVVLATRIRDRVRGPRWIATAVGLTVAAQLGVAPLLIPTFGPMRLVSIPANVLAEPAAAFVMMWGCTGGVVAGIVGGTIGVVLQWPTRVALWWIATIAHLAATVPSPEIGLVGLATLAVTIVVAATTRHLLQRRRVPMEAV